MFLSGYHADDDDVGNGNESIECGLTQMNRQSVYIFCCNWLNCLHPEKQVNMTRFTLMAHHFYYCSRCSLGGWRAIFHLILLMAHVMNPQ